MKPTPTFLANHALIISIAGNQKTNAKYLIEMLDEMSRVNPTYRDVANCYRVIHAEIEKAEKILIGENKS